MHVKMQSPKQIIAEGPGVSAGAVRLPPGEWIQVIHFAAGSIRYRYGNVVSPPLYVATQGAGPVLLHPGTEVFILLDQGAGTAAFIHVRGQIPETDREGYDT